MQSGASHNRHSRRRQSWSILLIAVCIGCDEVHRQRSATIVVSGDTAGWITPCGCAANQAGGLLRRATLLAGLDEPEHVLYLDAGGSAGGATEYQQIKLQAILRGLKEMNIVAHNIGGPEAALGPEALAKLAESTSITWLSSNLAPVSGESPAKRCVVVERDGFRIAVAGVVDPALVKHAGWSTREPVGSVLDAFRDVQADVHILLAYYDEPGLRSLAQSLPELDFIIGGPTGQAMKPATIGPVTAMSATNKGKFLAHIQLLRSGRDPFQTAQIGPLEVASDLAENRLQAENLAAYHDALENRDFTVAEAGLVADQLQADSNYRIAGSDSCAKCHAADETAWHSSPHAKAFGALMAKHAQFDPDCQHCHTTGYGFGGGFVSFGRTPQSVNVGCENCHGPSAAHVADPTTKTPFLARDQCIHCHDHENSPKFAFDAYWPKIRHGRPPSPAGRGPG